ncbi:hypothetical protein, partial [Candidatus Accumulibacter vicinus]|uniref:hypothetical protein n=1 Tax=Candidatus Accumulibacter vicinus TaxID=2954382 RepID=UPI00235B6BB3
GEGKTHEQDLGNQKQGRLSQVVHSYSPMGDVSNHLRWLCLPIAGDWAKFPRMPERAESLYNNCLDILLML